ncbi:MAG TPA: tRNA lysidine(34) synthetase TilS [Candidatus Saccharimonadales bacterium]|nr:tRNA lysidine(34) synthetase TilS [Candidatus Saccharimonadales bacterium]
MELLLPKPGKYIVAVSGGVDSVSLLHALQRRPGLELVVAHYDHGIRDNSEKDRIFVADLARQYELSFVYEEGALGPRASEAKAREARYNFLQRTQQEHNAAGLITAHHQDDVLETAIINMLRGTGRKGLNALSERPGIFRPLLNVPKESVLLYAKEQGLQWHEDETNSDDAYLRNYVRHNLLPRFSRADRRELIRIITDIDITNRELDDLLLLQLPFRPDTDSMDKKWFRQLPHAAAREVLAAWFRAHGIRDFNRGTLERLVIAAKTAQAGSSFDVLKGVNLYVDTQALALEHTER